MIKLGVSEHIPEIIGGSIVTFAVSLGTVAAMPVGSFSEADSYKNPTYRSDRANTLEMFGSDLFLFQWQQGIRITTVPVDDVVARIAEPTSSLGQESGAMMPEGGSTK